MSHRRSRVRWAVVLALATLVGAGCGGGSDGGSAWPEVSIQTIEGDSTTTADLVNDVPTVVSVWSVTCKACREELPALQDLAADRAGDIAVLGVDNGDDADDAQAYLDEIGVDIPMYLDVDGSLASAIGVSSLPATFIITPDGRIAWEHRGEVTRAQIEARLAELGV